MKKRIITAGLTLLLLVGLCGCETWPIAAARAAKKRTSQTGPVMGELQEAAGIEDPLGRKQNDIDDTADNMENKADGIGSKIEGAAEDI
ncbi:hypothetical protein [Cerasicoccus arenae]|uniref:Uncharacterized protein n=1 Tax=Cerasicoccus arenae TaxID=424488 RepID=A0A8J3GG76_9BACT|nr:hypothetical protein [Cerasicoccus arenae]MBK1857827.1 hypothetical protein [Cerasicoccus arenae]GHC11643.1 hypothetical protein GCM10007047_31160 [Cerasicoccus arenae]